MKLSAKMDRTADAVQRLQDENFRMKGQVARMEEQMFRVEAKKWEGAGSVPVSYTHLDHHSCGNDCDRSCHTGSYSYGQKERTEKIMTQFMSNSLFFGQSINANYYKGIGSISINIQNMCYLFEII